MATLREIIKDFLRGQKGCVATLKEIYRAVDNSNYVSNSDTLHDSARAIIYRHEEDFKRVCKGIYMLNSENSSSLLIEGNGRDLDILEDNSIDCIITDHPWQDKKAHRSGNNKNFADYDTFRYNQQDFNEKARVLKNGCFIAEFLPVESATNYEYLYEIKKMAHNAGLNYYCTCLWRNAKEGTINQGKTTKGVQNIVIFYKGDKPRKLSRDSVNSYQTSEILNYEIEMLLSHRDKVHQAEKPVELYKYLIKRLTSDNPNEREVVLDTFGGSCNLIKACEETGRFAIVVELCHKFVESAVKRFNLGKLYETDDECPTEFTPTNLYRNVQYTYTNDGQMALAI